MKLCLKHQHPFIEATWKCPTCSDEPAQLGHFMAFAPTLEERNNGFNPNLFQRFAAVEAVHFWFVARKDILCDRMLRHFPNAKNIFEIGCGTGFVLSNVHQAFPAAQLTGSDIFTEGLGFAKRRVPSALLYQMDACQIPFVEEFDLIGAFDVLEHIDDDQAALGQIYQACQSGGGIILTVPQHRWLWSSTDDYAHHKRRYTRTQLVGKVERAGFRVEYVGSFVFLLLPAMLASRLLQKSAQSSDRMDDGFKIGRLTNKLFGAVMKVERWLINKGLSFPLGGSLLLVAKKVE